MKWSAVSALLAAPLALAGTIQADVVARNDGKEMMGSNDYGMGQTEVIVEEIILVWTCNGGGESTKTMNDMSTMAGSAVATHTVGLFTISDVIILM